MIPIEKTIGYHFKALEDNADISAALLQIISRRYINLPKTNGNIDGALRKGGSYWLI